MDGGSNRTEEECVAASRFLRLPPLRGPAMVPRTMVLPLSQTSVNKRSRLIFSLFLFVYNKTTQNETRLPLFFPLPSPLLFFCLHLRALCCSFTLLPCPKFVYTARSSLLVPVVSSKSAGCYLRCTRDEQAAKGERERERTCAIP
jgi:hypothetical protein